MTVCAAEDRVVEAVREKLLARSEAGRRKYGTTLDREDLSLSDWVRHAQEEAMDLSLYLEKIAQLLEKAEDDLK